MTLTSYVQIRDAVVGSADSTLCDKLDEFKVEYKVLINSRRMTSKIKSFKELITVLEKRCCLSEGNVDVLHKIASRLNNKEFLEMVNSYELNIPVKKEVDTLHVLRRSSNRSTYETSTPVGRFNNQERQVLESFGYGSADAHKGAAQPPLISNPYFACPQPASAPMYEPRLPPEAIEIISEEMGSSWQAFARHIAVKEGEIDYLVSRYDLNIKEKLVKCLELFTARTRHVDVRNTLHGALCKVRRHDVSEQIVHMLINAGL